MVERRTDGSAARRAAQLMAQLCSSTATARTKHDLALLVATERITLADFVRELSALADDRGADAYRWEQDKTPPVPTHVWRLQKAEDVVRDGGAALDVRLRCAHCGAVATFAAGALPPCTPGGTQWRWTGSGWQRAENGSGSGTPG